MQGIANKELFEKEKDDLIQDLRSLPKNTAVRKVIAPGVSVWEMSGCS